MDSIPYFVPERRPLTAAEAALVEWLVRRAGPSGEPFLEQLPKLRVEARCGCLGCPTVGFSVDGAGAMESGEFAILVEALGKSAEGAVVGLMLLVRKRRLSELEVHCFSDHDRWSLPAIESLEVV